MVIHDKKIVALVDEQRAYYLEDAPLEKKIDVQKRIVKRQKELMKIKDN